MTPEARYLHLMRDLRARKLLMRFTFVMAVVLSVVLVVASRVVLLTFLTVVTIWAGAFLMRYFARHGSTILAYMRTMRRFFHEQDGVAITTIKITPENKLLSDSEQHAFDDLINRLKNS